MGGLRVKHATFPVGLVGILCGACVSGSSGGPATAFAFSHSSFLNPISSCNTASTNKPQGPCRAIAHSSPSLPPPLLLRGASPRGSKRSASRRGFSLNLESGSAGTADEERATLGWPLSALGNSGGDGEAERRPYLRLARSADGSSFELSTCTVTLERSLAEGEVEEVKLASVIHVADAGGYYAILQERLDACDRVLYELVLPRAEREVDSEGRVRPQSARAPTDQQMFLAREFGLAHQLQEMNFSSQKWTVGDLDLESIRELSARAREEMQEGYSQGVADPLLARAARTLADDAVQDWYDTGGGSASAPPSLVAKGGVVAAAAAALFLPCPALSWLLCRWTWANAGRVRLPQFLALARLILAQDFASARKLQYAQFLETEQFQVQAGVYQVLLGARNRQALAQLSDSGGEGKVGLLYGVLHMPDLEESLNEMGFRSGRQAAWNVAWRIPAEASHESRGRLAAAILLLVVGCGVDWWDFSSHLVHQFDCFNYGAEEIVRSTWPGTEIVVPVTMLTQCPFDNLGKEAAKTVIPYVLRHLWLYTTLNNIVFSLD